MTCLDPLHNASHPLQSPYNIGVASWGPHRSEVYTARLFFIGLDQGPSPHKNTDKVQQQQMPSSVNHMQNNGHRARREWLVIAHGFATTAAHCLMSSGWQGMSGTIASSIPSWIFSHWVKVLFIHYFLLFDWPFVTSWGHSAPNETPRVRGGTGGRYCCLCLSSYQVISSLQEISQQFLCVGVQEWWQWGESFWNSGHKYSCLYRFYAKCQTQSADKKKAQKVAKKAESIMLQRHCDRKISI